MCFHAPTPVHDHWLTITLIFLHPPFFSQDLLASTLLLSALKKQKRCFLTAQSEQERQQQLYDDLTGDGEKMSTSLSIWALNNALIWKTWRANMKHSTTHRGNSRICPKVTLLICTLRHNRSNNVLTTNHIAFRKRKMKAVAGLWSNHLALSSCVSITTHTKERQKRTKTR